MRVNIQHFQDMGSIRCRAVVCKYSKAKRNSMYPRNTLMISEVKHDDMIISDHLWFVLTKFWKRVKVGDIIEFNATVHTYKKGYKGKSIKYQIKKPLEDDYTLADLNNLSIIGNVYDSMDIDQLERLGIYEYQQP